MYKIYTLIVSSSRRLKINTGDISTFNSTMFYVGLFIKILFGSLFASKYLTGFFIPFVDFFVDSNFANPYEHFYNLGLKAHFPYPTLMLYVVALPKILFGWILPDNSFFTLFIYRLPLIIADLAIFVIIKGWLKSKFRGRLIWFYWLSPVLIYINYIHGQLDVIPISLLFGSLYFLFKDSMKLSSLFLGLSLAAKTNVLLAFPFFFLFLLSKYRIRDVILFFVISISVFFAINFPYIFNSAFVDIVFRNPEQNKILSSYVSFDGLQIYWIPLTLLMLFVRGVLLKNYNKDIFLMLLGFSFSIILLFIPPMQGWYFWLLPFLIYFYIKEDGRSPLLIFVLQVFYLLYFMVSRNSDFLEVFQFISIHISIKNNFYTYLLNSEIDPDVVVNFVFTALQATLMVNCFWIYRKGLESYSKHKITASPFLIGIGGNSGAGKTTISDALLDLFTPSNTTVLRGDDMHRWQRNHDKWNELTHLDPKANFLHKEINFLKKLKVGKKIYRRHYDHNTGSFTNDNLLKPRNLIIFEGLHPFYLPSQRLLYDLKIFIKPSSDLMSHWKIIRDIERRGYSKEVILESIKKREEDSVKYIETQTNKADIVIEAFPVNKIKNIGDKNEKVDIFYKVSLLNIVYIDPIIESLQTIKTLEVTHEYVEEDHQCVELRGSCPVEEVKKCTINCVDNLEDLGVINPTWQQGNFGALILLLTYYIFEKAENVRE